MPVRTVDRVRRICLGLPEVVETTTFGHPTWRAGRKTFAVIEESLSGPVLQFRADPERQPELVDDERFDIPKYVGQHGWLNLRLETDWEWNEVEHLLLASYRLVALKRMLKALED